MAKVTYVLAQGENSAGESQINFRVYISRELRLRVPSGIWIDRKRWGNFWVYFWVSIFKHTQL